MISVKAAAHRYTHNLLYFEYQIILDQQKFISSVKMHKT